MTAAWSLGYGLLGASVAPASHSEIGLGAAVLAMAMTRGRAQGLPEATLLGLVQPWGEVYLRWIPVAGGKPIRPRTVIIPASLVAVLMTAAGLEHYRAAILGYVPEGSMSENWGTVAPGYLWPLWGVALGAATYAYRQPHEHLSRGAAVGGVGHRLGRRPPPLVAAGYRGVAGCIQVTNRTYQRLRDGYRFQRRGPIQVRGMGEMVTYFLVGRN